MVVSGIIRPFSALFVAMLWQPWSATQRGSELIPPQSRGLSLGRRPKNGKRTGVKKSTLSGDVIRFTTH
jgi:hypothetical protein